MRACHARAGSARRLAIAPRPAVGDQAAGHWLETCTVHRMRRRALIAGLAVAVLGAAFALASGGRPAPSAVARALPAHYRLLLTEVFDRGRLHVAHYGRLSGDPGDAPISIYSVRGHAKPSYEYSPDRQPGDGRATGRGGPRGALVLVACR